MTAEEALFQLCERWRVLSSGEGAGIAAEDWPRVLECQQAKRDLQPQIDQLLRRASDAGDRDSGLSPRIRGLARELIDLEARNAEVLALKRASLESNRKALGQQASLLRRLHGSYGTATAAHWQTYS